MTHRASETAVGKTLVLHQPTQDHSLAPHVLPQTLPTVIPKKNSHGLKKNKTKDTVIICFLRTVSNWGAVIFFIVEKINAHAFINIAPSCQPLENVFNRFLNISNYGIFFIVITDLL